MKTEMNAIAMNNNLVELNLEDLENVTGGGIREIVAMGTLAAMAMTGNTVSAFGLARALAEDAAVFETTDEAVAFDEAFEGFTADRIDVACDAAEAQVGEVEFELGGEAEVAEPVQDSMADAAFQEDAEAEAAEGFIEDEPGVEDIDVAVLEQIIADTLDAHAGETLDAAIAAVFENLEGGAPRGLIVEALYKVLTDRLGSEVDTETIMAAIDAGMALAEARAAEGDEGVALEDVLADMEEKSPLRSMIDGILDENGGGLVAMLDAVNGRLHGGVEESELRGALLEALTERFGGELTAEELLDAIEASFVRAREDETVMAGVSDEERRALLSQLIHDTVAARSGEGIYAALDSTLEAVVFNESGLIDEEGNAAVETSEIVSMTYDALEENFDNTPEELMGAIGAAALRAENSGLMAVLTGDQHLVALAEQENIAEETRKQAKDLTRSALEKGIDAMGQAHPVLKALSPLLKGLLNAAMSEEETDPTEEIKARLDEIDQKLDTIEQNLKDHMQNVVSLAELGGEYGSVAKTTTVLREKLGNIWDARRDISYEQRVSETAALYGTNVVTNLETAIVGATFAFQGETNITFGNESIFSAAYRTACLNVMFSKEAIDASAPYISRQLADYIAGYATLNIVYDAYEETFGSDMLLATRDNMSMRLGGIDRDGNKTGKSMADLCTDYFNGYKYTFVNKSNNTAIKLNKDILYVFDFATKCTKRSMISSDKRDRKAPDFMKNVPLSNAQVKALAEYCKGKNTSLFQFLFNTVGFEPKLMIERPNLFSDPSMKVEPFPKMYFDEDLGMGWSKAKETWEVSEQGMKNMYLAAGAQKEFFYEEWDNHNMRIRMEAIKAAEITDSCEKVLLNSARWRGTDPEGPTKGMFMMFFQEG